MSSPQRSLESTYEEFSHAPISCYEGHIPHAPMTMAGPDGSILYENALRQLLHEIIRRDDVTSLERYLATDPGVLVNGCYDYPCYYYWFPTAVDSGSFGALRVLLSHHEMDPDCVSYRKEFGFTLLIEAAHRTHIDFVKFLLDNHYADIHERDSRGGTAILSAADFYPNYDVDYWDPSVEKSEATMNLLLDRGACAADVMPLWDNTGTKETVLTSAVQWAGPELIKRLIDGGADVHATVTRNSYDLEWEDYYPHPGISNIGVIAFASYYLNSSVVQTLVDSRGDGVEVQDMVSFRDSSGGHPLHWVTRSHMSFAQKYIRSKAQKDQNIKDIIKVINLMLDIDPSAINTQDDVGNTPLHYVTRHLLRHDKEYTAVFQLLCNKGADASIRNCMGETPLHTLANLSRMSRSSDTTYMNILLAYGARVTDLDKNGNSPLHLAVAQMNHAEVISFLLEQGADASLMNVEHNTPLHIAALLPFWGRDKNDELQQYQEHVMAMLVKTVGEAGIGILNGDGKTAQQILEEQTEIGRRIHQMVDAPRAVG